MSISERKKVKAIKQHECHYCHKPIYPGDYYIVSKFLDNEIFRGYKMHDPCETKFLNNLDHLDSLNNYFGQN